MAQQTTETTATKSLTKSVNKNTNMKIKDISKKIHQNAREKGFWDTERNFGELLMLVTSELGEALEAHRKRKHSDYVHYRLICNDQPTEVQEEVAFLVHIKDTVEDEIADAVIRLFDLAEGMGIDLEWHIEQKLKYNKTRERLHGKAY